MEFMSMMLAGSSGFAMGKCSWAGEDGLGGMAIDRSKVPGIQGIR